MTGRFVARWHSLLLVEILAGTGSVLMGAVEPGVDRDVPADQSSGVGDLLEPDPCVSQGTDALINPRRSTSDWAYNSLLKIPSQQRRAAHTSVC